MIFILTSIQENKGNTKQNNILIILILRDSLLKQPQITIILFWSPQLQQISFALGSSLWNTFHSVFFCHANATVAYKRLASCSSRSYCETWPDCLNKRLGEEGRAGTGLSWPVRLHKAFQVCILYLLSQWCSLEHQFIAKASFTSYLWCS